MRPTIVEVKKLFGDKPIIGAEIGVNTGANAGDILSYLPNLTMLHLVDAWKANEDYQDQGLQDQCLAMVKKRFETDKRCLIMHMPSVEAARFIPDNSLDFVYIDAEHRYFGIRADIDAWLPKVKKGGIIGGHDYDYPIRPGVKEAVDEVFGNRVNLHDSQNDWWVYL